MKEKLLEAAKSCFETNTKDELYHITADGQCFTKWHDANEHSKVIGDRKIVVIDRKDVEDKKAEVVEPIEPKKGKGKNA